MNFTTRFSSSYPDVKHILHEYQVKIRIHAVVSGNAQKWKTPETEIDHQSDSGNLIRLFSFLFTNLLKVITLSLFNRVNHCKLARYM